MISEIEFIGKNVKSAEFGHQNSNPSPHRLQNLKEGTATNTNQHNHSRRASLPGSGSTTRILHHMPRNELSRHHMAKLNARKLNKLPRLPLGTRNPGPDRPQDPKRPGTHRPPHRQLPAAHSQLDTRKERAVPDMPPGSRRYSGQKHRPPPQHPYGCGRSMRRLPRKTDTHPTRRAEGYAPKPVRNLPPETQRIPDDRRPLHPEMHRMPRLRDLHQNRFRMRVLPQLPRGPYLQHLDKLRNVPHASGVGAGSRQSRGSPVNLKAFEPQLRGMPRRQLV